jgi:NAD(P)-dependent dehydrogenase (short-subunit alcohol dehydrogenase family)
MLDAKTDPVAAAGAGVQGRRIIVLGACCGFGRAMIRTLGAAGAQVVAADTGAQALARLGGRAVPLTLRGAPEEALRRVGRAWGEARLDAVLNLMPLRHPGKVDLNIAVLQGVVQAFLPALMLREGQIVSVVSQPEQPLDVAAGAMAPALLSAQTAFVHALQRDGLTLNLVHLGAGGALGPARLAVSSLLAGSLGALNGSELRL